LKRWQNDVQIRLVVKDTATAVLQYSQKNADEVMRKRFDDCVRRSIVPEAQSEDTAAVVRARVRLLADPYTLRTLAKTANPRSHIVDLKAESQSQSQAQPQQNCDADSVMGASGSEQEEPEEQEEQVDATQADWGY
jgi:hypothetical protein